ncbi:MAG: ABC transporter substrate-binding protein [Rhodospirillaceae bacterium]|nr:ABC transporter substrate-binding protein [Rhodospirillaceae bacterium]
MRIELAGVLACCVMAAAGLAAAAPPQRIVSMNLCTDQYALLLAPRARIASISFLGADPAESPLADRAAGLPVNYGTAEEAIALTPDLVLTGTYTTAGAKAMLRRLGYPVVEVDNPTGFAGIAETMRRMGALFGAEDEAETQVAAMQRRLAAVVDARRGRPRAQALVYDANGFTVGRPSLADAVMDLAGLDNLAPSLGIDAYGQLGLEDLLIARPRHLVRLVYRPDAVSLASAALRHPAIDAAMGGRPFLDIPGRLLTCGTPLVAEAAERLAAAVERAP